MHAHRNINNQTEGKDFEKLMKKKILVGGS